MSAIVQHNKGDLRNLQFIVDRWNGSDPVKIHLIKATFTPSSFPDLAALTVADFPGYAPVEASGWTNSHLVSNKARTEADLIPFTRTSTGTAQDIYGIAAEDVSNPGDILFSELWDAVVTVTNAGEGVNVYPQYTQDKDA